jgi:transposase
MEAYPRAAMERAMKVQDVMLQAMAKKITWWQAAEILGISDRHMRRWRERYVEEGYNGLLDRRRGQPSRRTGAGGDGGESVGVVPGKVFRSERAALS